MLQNALHLREANGSTEWHLLVSHRFELRVRRPNLHPSGYRSSAMCSSLLLLSLERFLPFVVQRNPLFRHT